MTEKSDRTIVIFVSLAVSGKFSSAQPPLPLLLILHAPSHWHHFSSWVRPWAFLPEHMLLPFSRFFSLPLLCTITFWFSFTVHLWGKNSHSLTLFLWDSKSPFPGLIYQICTHGCKQAGRYCCGFITQHQYGTSCIYSD